LQRSGTSLGPLAAAAARLHRFILCNIQHCQDKQRRARMQSARAVSQLAHARETQLNTVCQVSQVVYTNRRGLGRLQSPISSQYVGPVMLSGVEPAMGKLVSIRGSTAAASVVVQPPCSVRFSCEGQPGNAAQAMILSRQAQDKHKASRNLPRQAQDYVRRSSPSYTLSCSLQRRVFFNFSYVCPEPVLANIRFQSIEN